MKICFAGTGLLFFLLAAGFSSCAHEPDGPDDPQDTIITGYDFLKRVPGIWGGPVVSGTLLGDFPDWQQDFRPISSSQVSTKSELDKQNDIFMNFFVGKSDGKEYLFFRNGGHFAAMQRVSYLVCDSVNDLGGHYYRFSDAKAGPGRVRSEVTFRNDSMIFVTHVNNNFHFRYSAARLDSTLADTVAGIHGYPQETVVKDLSGVFDGQPDAVFHSFAGDPYPESEHPYLGQTQVNYTFSGVTPDINKNVLVILSARPLFNGLTFNAANLIYRSRYVLLKASETSFTFTFMHPGRYYANLLYDVNGDLMVNSGDYVSFPFDQSLQLAPLGSASINPVISIQVP